MITNINTEAVVFMDQGMQCPSTEPQTPSHRQLIPKIIALIITLFNYHFGLGLLKIASCSWTRTSATSMDTQTTS
jgi:hypothetical protein